MASYFAHAVSSGCWVVLMEVLFIYFFHAVFAESFLELLMGILTANSATIQHLTFGSGSPNTTLADSSAASSNAAAYLHLKRLTTLLSS